MYWNKDIYNMDFRIDARLTLTWDVLKCYIIFVSSELF